MRESEAEFWETLQHLRAAHPELKPQLGEQATRTLCRAHALMARQVAMLQRPCAEFDAARVTGRQPTAEECARWKTSDAPVKQLDLEADHAWRSGASELRAIVERVAA